MLKIVLILLLGTVSSSIAFLGAWGLSKTLYGLGWHASNWSMAGTALVAIFAIDILLLYVSPFIVKGLRIYFSDYLILAGGFVIGGLLAVGFLIFAAVQLANVT
jgi:hypothetical protein